MKNGFAAHGSLERVRSVYRGSLTSQRLVAPGREIGYCSFCLDAYALEQRPVAHHWTSLFLWRRP